MTNQFGVNFGQTVYSNTVRGLFAQEMSALMFITFHIHSSDVYENKHLFNITGNKNIWATFALKVVCQTFSESGWVKGQCIEDSSFALISYICIA